MIRDAGRRFRWSAPAGLAVAAGVAWPALAQPMITTWPVSGAADVACTAGAAVSGWYAAASTREDSVEIRGIDRAVVRTITRAELAALLPWMDLSPGPDGPSALAFSDSGRLLFVLVHDAAAAPSGSSDAVLRYDTGTGQLSVFARLELFGDDATWPHLGAAHFKGRLYVGAFGFGGPGAVSVYSADASATTGSLLGTYGLPGGTSVHGLGVDRLNDLLYAASESAIYRASLASLPLSFMLVGAIPAGNLRGLAYSDQYGAVFNVGLYALQSTGSAAAASLVYVPPLQAQGVQPFAPTTYVSLPQELHSLAATADGNLLAGAAAEALLISDQADTRLSYSAWLGSEFQQIVLFARNLISPDGEPPGWVIDGDVEQGLSRFAPASPDGAAWTILALLMADAVNSDALARGQVRSILVRYAGMAADGIRPSLTADGIMRHWIEPLTGQAKAGWDPEFATLSTMLISAAAARAKAYYPDDAVIQQAAARILCQVRNHDAYFAQPNDATFFKGLPGGGPDTTSRTQCFNESILWAEQLAAYGGSSSVTSFSHWLDRSRWPTATYLAGRPITGDVAGQFQSAFTSLYPMLLMPAFRASAAWQQQVAAIRSSNNGWMDDYGPRFNTVFSAGTTRSDWGGYHADSLGSHPGDVTTFPSLLAVCSAPASAAHPNRAAESVGAYNAYRRGGRQAFATGASILYRRSDVDPAYRPNSAGLPDVVLGAMGLADLMQPGVVDAVLGVRYPPCGCYGNCDGSTATPVLNVNDFICFQSRFAAGDPWANCDGSATPPVLNVNDFVCFQSRFAAGCP